MWDSAGNKYLDLAGSAAVNLIGHGVAEIAAAMAEQAAKLEFVHTSQFTTPIAEEYAAELLAFAENISTGARSTYLRRFRIGRDGAETRAPVSGRNRPEPAAPDTQPTSELSRIDAWRVVGLGNKRRREMYLPMVREFPHIGMPYCYRCEFDCTDGCRNCGQQYAAELKEAIESANGEAAGFIFEPVSGATSARSFLRPDTCNRSPKSAAKVACFSSPMKS